jgi:hypothetical protein
MAYYLQKLRGGSIMEKFIPYEKLSKKGSEVGAACGR